MFGLGKKEKKIKCAQCKKEYGPKDIKKTSTGKWCCKNCCPHKQSKNKNVCEFC